MAVVAQILTERYKPSFIRPLSSVICPLSSTCLGEATLAKPGAYPKPLFCPNSFCRQSVILQNKPNLKKCETALILCLQKIYETATPRNCRKNKAKTKPICKNAKMNLNPCSELTYEDNRRFPPPPKQIGACLATLFGGFTRLS